MNNLNKTLLTLLMLVTTAVITYTYMESNYVKVESTKSGKFVIDHEHIYELVELDKPEPFINSYKHEAVK